MLGIRTREGGTLEDAAAAERLRGLVDPTSLRSEDDPRAILTLRGRQVADWVTRALA